ncbi:YciI family protein [Fulvivirgaceae bacterium BMA12]|uniref:YciI family protein n=1 Tax=Agaribacillus aureus TaxID=3051825 RepID=A0ABT8L0N4_9BACT|nr:YciI family protein [Fulvivirgaceae bacterium BMA12]
MKDFMLIFIGVSYAEMNLSPEEIQNRAASWMSWNEKMAKQGVLKEGNALQEDLRRVKGPDRTVTDRTSAELKELIGGYYIVKAADFEGAIEIAQDYPDFDLGGTVEVREVMHYN